MSSPSGRPESASALRLGRGHRRYAADREARPVVERRRLLTLRDIGVRFVVADMPEANDLTVGVMALVAEHQGEMISRRTREALEAAEARRAARQLRR